MVLPCITIRIITETVIIRIPVVQVRQGFLKENDDLRSAWVEDTKLSHRFVQHVVRLCNFEWNGKRIQRPGMKPELEVSHAHFRMIIL